MEIGKWFDNQLRITLDGFTWSVQQIPEERWYALPPSALGEWSVAQHIFHLVHYESRLAFPSMQQWLGAPPAVLEEAEEDAWNHPPPVRLMLDQLQEVRLAQVNLLSSFDEAAWQSTRKTTFWGDVSLYWLVCKTYQHTLDHTKDLLALALFWDRQLARRLRE